MQQINNNSSCLLIIDVQNDFCEGGSLAVQKSLEIIPIINQLHSNNKFKHVIFTQDFHPKGHVSFASSHKGQNPFTNITLPNGKIQELWPDHCVQGTQGCQFHNNLVVKQEDLIVQKGSKQQIDSYTGFGSENDETNLKDILKNKGLQKVFVVGLAYDFCVGSTAIDAAKLNYDVYIITDATKSVMPQTEKIMDEKISKYLNIHKILSKDIEKYL